MAGDEKEYEFGFAVQLFIDIDPAPYGQVFDTRLAAVSFLLFVQTGALGILIILRK